MDIATAIGSVYGSGAEEAFLPLWRKHIGFVVDYTTVLATKDKAKQDKAVNDLVGYTQDLGAFLSAANPNLPKNVVADLVQGHILSLTSHYHTGADCLENSCQPGVPVVASQDDHPLRRCPVLCHARFRREYREYGTSCHAVPRAPHPDDAAVCPRQGGAS